MSRTSKVEQAVATVVGRSLRTQIKELCGDFLGRGVYRDVYILKHDPRFVVKVERDMTTGNFANVCEWRFWIDNEWWTDLSQWLAPCQSITETGQVLIQRRVRRYKSRSLLTHIPRLFTDTKVENFGWIGNSFVCCDYAFVLMTNHVLRPKRIYWNY